MHVLLHNRNYLLLWLGQLASGIADVLYQVAIMVAVFELTGSALQTAGVMIAARLPPFLLSPFAGALADRFSRRLLMLFAAVLRALFVGLLLLFAGGESLNIWGIYLVVAGLSAATAFHDPSRQAIIPSLVSQDDIVRANSLILGAIQVAFVIGYGFGGLLAVRISLQVLIFLDMFLFLLAAALLFLIRPQVDTDPGPALSARRPLFRTIRDGASYLRAHALARPLVVMEVAEHVPHGIWSAAMMLVFVQTALGGDSSDWGLQSAAFFLGQIVGAVIATAAAVRVARRPGWIIIWNALLSGLLTVVYALSPTNLFALVLAFVFGPPSAVRDVAQDALLQTSVAKEVLGRIFAMRNMLLNVTFMLSGLGFAWLADYVPVRWIYIIGGLLYFLTALYAYSRPALRDSKIRQEQAVAAVAAS